MITEDYVSFETAKFLKEKGFDELTYACFSNDGKETYYGYRAVNDDIMRPTIQMAMKWLREKYHIHISPYQATITLWDFQLFNLLKTDTMGCKPISRPHLTKYYSKTCEEACEVAIKYILENLI